MGKIDKKWIFDSAKKSEVVPPFLVFHPQDDMPAILSYAVLQSEPSRIPRPKIPIGTKLYNFESIA
jgi:hypothetical protein